MMLKRKKVMWFLEFMNWAVNKEFENTKFVSTNGYVVGFEAQGFMYMDHSVPTDEMFRVEIKELITEDTKIPVLVERYIGLGGNIKHISYKEVSIKELLKDNPEGVKSTHFYSEDKDGKLTLIWRDGGLIE